MKNIFIYVETFKGQISNLSKEMFTKAREIADTLEKELVAVVIGENISNASTDAIKYGADKVVKVENSELKDYRTLPYATTFNKLIDKYSPDIIIMPASINGRDLAGRICARRQIGLVAECSDIKITEDKKDIAWIRPTFDGKLFSDIRISTSPMIGTVGNGAFLPAKKDENRNGDIIEENIEISLEDILTEILSFKEKDKAGKEEELKNAKIIVSGGMGLKEPENWHIVTELAEVLGAEVGATKPVCDYGWCSISSQVGVTGTVVKPDLYIALGISGAIQHTKGIEKSSLIIAINNDKDAPIFKTAHYGIVGDVFEIVPKLTEKIKNM